MATPSFCILGDAIDGSKVIFRVPADVIVSDDGDKWQWVRLVNYGNVENPVWKHHYKPLEGLDIEVTPQQAHKPPHVYDDLPWPFLPHET